MAGVESSQKWRNSFLSDAMFSLALDGKKYSPKLIRESGKREGERRMPSRLRQLPETPGFRGFNHIIILQGL